MSARDVLDIASAVCLLGGCFLALAAAIGIVRFPDLLTRVHASAKPQTLGLMLILTGIGLRMESVGATTMLFVIAAVQLVTAPIAAHMVSRTAVEFNPIREDLLIVDELHSRDTPPPP